VLLDPNGGSEPDYRESYTTIIKDLNRTHPELNLFKEGEKWFESLKNVLMVYCVHRPDIGYVQGMSYIAAAIILSMKNELKAFTIMANLLGRENMLNEFYQFNMTKVNVEFETFLYLLSERMPELHQKLQQLNLSCHIFLFEWIVTMYSNIFDLDFAIRIWDNILFHGEYFTIKVALAICQCVEDKIKCLK